MHRFQQYASVHSTATVRSEHSSHRALHEIFTTGSIISARSFMSPVMLSVTWQRLEISHTVSQNSACPRRLKWRQIRVPLDCSDAFGGNALPSTLQRWASASHLFAFLFAHRIAFVAQGTHTWLCVLHAALPSKGE